MRLASLFYTYTYTYTYTNSFLFKIAGPTPYCWKSVFILGVRGGWWRVWIKHEKMIIICCDVKPILWSALLYHKIVQKTKPAHVFQNLLLLSTLRLVFFHHQTQKQVQLIPIKPNLINFKIMLLPHPFPNQAIVLGYLGHGLQLCSTSFCEVPKTMPSSLCFFFKQRVLSNRIVFFCRTIRAIRGNFQA